MIPLRLGEIARMCGAEAPEFGADAEVYGISKDTRTLRAGELYLALRGENFDGNQFVAEAALRGAAGAIAENPEVVGKLAEKFPVIWVGDCLTALNRLAASYRERLALRVVGITGSNGKTSTKELTAAVLSSVFRVTKTEGSLNNHIGVPLSILEAEEADEMAVWEVGMNHPGEIEPLAGLIRPDIGIVTNIGVAHIENLGSREAIAREKAALLEALSADGLAIIPDQDDYADYLASRTVARVERVGGEGSNLRAESVVVTLEGVRFQLISEGNKMEAFVPALGRHMVNNALLAVAAGLASGVSLSECVEGLARARLVSGRMTRRELRGVIFLDDTYNANPDSMVAALRTLGEISAGGRKWALLGEMGELGEYAHEGYCRVGRQAAECVDGLIVVGSEASEMAEVARRSGLADVWVVGSPEEAAEALRGFVGCGDYVLVKGSRSAGMERVLQAF